MKYSSPRSAIQKIKTMSPASKKKLVNKNKNKIIKNIDTAKKQLKFKKLLKSIEKNLKTQIQLGKSIKSLSLQLKKLRI